MPSRNCDGFALSATRSVVTTLKISVIDDIGRNGTARLRLSRRWLERNVRPIEIGFLVGVINRFGHCALENVPSRQDSREAITLTPEHFFVNTH